MTVNLTNREVKKKTQSINDANNYKSLSLAKKHKNIDTKLQASPGKPIRVLDSIMTQGKKILTLHLTIFKIFPHNLELNITCLYVM